MYIISEIGQIPKIVSTYGHFTTTTWDRKDSTTLSARIIIIGVHIILLCTYLCGRKKDDCYIRGRQCQRAGTHDLYSAYKGRPLGNLRNCSRARM